MPTIHRESSFRFYFYSHEPHEPAHVHVDRQGANAKFWLEPVSLACNMGYSQHELMELLTILRTNRYRFLEAWHGYFGSGG